VKWLERAARVCAVVAGVLLVAITLVTCVSLIGRNTGTWSMPGAYEMTGFAAGAAIALFLPWCQARRGNIIVDFFTTGASERVQGGLDRVGALAVGICMAILTWRTSVGGLNAWGSGAGSMMMGLPEWWVYAGMIPPLALTALIAFAQAAVGFGRAQETGDETAMEEHV
jgi:TRAP-type C4-dicarboxylate transport system permease small subunit